MPGSRRSACITAVMVLALASEGTASATARASAHLIVERFQRAMLDIRSLLT